MTQSTVKFFHYVIQGVLALNLVLSHLHNLQKESQTGTISASQSFCSQFCTGGSFSWNYGTETFYGNYVGDNNCCIYAGFEVVLSVTGMLVNLCYRYVGESFCCNYAVTVCAAIMQLEVSAALLHVTVSAANIRATTFIIIIQM